MEKNLVRELIKAQEVQNLDYMHISLRVGRYTGVLKDRSLERASQNVDLYWGTVDVVEI